MKKHDRDDFDDYSGYARTAIQIEARAIQALESRIDALFEKACKILMPCQGRVIVMGMGKSSYIAGKIAATLASTGTPAFFVHPGEASHGDLGMITLHDIVIAISNSGETPEILALLPLIKHLGIKLISLTGNVQSTLAVAADVNLDVSVAVEACPLGLAPTASTTAALVMGDALAVALLQARGFTAADFARSHPGGRLGKRLLLTVRDIMISGDLLPIITIDQSVSDALMEMTQKKLGLVVVLDNHNNNTIAGIYTDGDLRRSVLKNVNLTHNIGLYLSANPKIISRDKLAVEALHIMESNRITSLVVVDESSKKLVGIIHMHDLLRAGVA